METDLLTLQLNFCSVLVDFFPRKWDATAITEHVHYTYFFILHSPFYFTPLVYSCLMEILNWTALIIHYLANFATYSSNDRRFGRVNSGSYQSGCRRWKFFPRGGPTNITIWIFFPRGGPTNITIWILFPLSLLLCKIHFRLSGTVVF
jgi:hypothetical protein